MDPNKMPVHVLIPICVLAYPLPVIGIWTFWYPTERQAKQASRHKTRQDSRAATARRIGECWQLWRQRNIADCQLLVWEQRNHVLKYESDCVIIGIGIKIWIVEGFVRDCFVEFLSSTPQSNGNILSVLEQVFIPAVSHMKIANVHVGTKYQNVRIALQFSYQFAIFILIYNFHISLQFSRFGV